MSRRRRSDADTIESVTIKIEQQRQYILDHFESLDRCKQLFNEWEGRRREDDEARQGHSAWKKLLNLERKKSQLEEEQNRIIVQEEEQNRLRAEQENVRRRDEERRRLEQEGEESSDQEEESSHHGDEERTILDRIRSIRNQIVEQEEAMISDFGSLKFCEQSFDDVNAGRLSDETAQEACLAHATLNDLYAELRSTYGLLNDRNSREEGDDGLTEILSPLRIGGNDFDIDVEMEDLAHDDDSNEDLCGDICQNCRRKQFTNEEFFCIDFIQVLSHKISKAYYINENIQVRRSENTAEPIDLCIECWNHLRNPNFHENGEAKPPLVDSDDESESAEEDEPPRRRRRRKKYMRHKSQGEFTNTAYAFLWNLLSGGHKNGTLGSYYFAQVCGGEMLWSMIPTTMRHWWIDAIQDIYQDGEYPYSSCTLEYPPCIFEDKTNDFVRFEEDVARSLPSMADALNRTEVMNPNVLCPFGCSDCIRNCHSIRWDLMIQFILKDVVLNLPSDVMKKYRHFMASSDDYYRKDDTYSFHLMKKDWKVKPAVIKTKDHGWAALSCARHKGLGDKQRLYPPRNSQGYNVNPSYPDQIGPIQMRPRIAKQVKTSKYGCGSVMIHQNFDFKGVDGFSISQGSSFRNMPLLEQNYGVAAVAGRHDIRSYLSHMGDSNDISPRLVQQLLDCSAANYPSGIDNSLTDGATYVPFEVAMKLHLFSKHENVFILRYLDDENSVVDKPMKRAWPRLINTIQKQDSTGYGYQFRPIPPINVGNSIVSWILFSLMSSSSELWSLIDSKDYFEKDGWEGHALTNIGHHCFQNETITVSSKCPFAKINKFDRLVKAINQCIGIGIDEPVSIDSLSGELFGRIFNSQGDAVKVFGASPDEEPLIGITENTKFLLFVTNDRVCDDIINRDDNEFEHRSMCCMKSKGNKYEAVRYMRYGGHYKSYWQQHRDNWITNKFSGVSDLMMQYFSDEWMFVSLYVRREDAATIDKYRVDFLKSLGGQADVFCQECQCPLIPSHVPKEMKLRCNVSTGDQPCNRKESFVCSTPGCNLRCCQQCFRENSTNGPNMLVPRDDDNDDDMEDNNDETMSDDEDDESGSEYDEDSTVDSDHDDDIDVYADAGQEVDTFDVSIMSERDMNDALVAGINGPNSFMYVSGQSELLEHSEVLDHTCPHLVYSEQEGEFESFDDINLEDTIPTTNAGLFSSRVFQRQKAGLVSGHVLLNQVGGTLHRHNSRVTGTQREQNFVQTLASTKGGQSLSLLYPESSIFVRHFHSSSSDRLSPLGALPLWMFRGGNQLGFASMEDHLRSRITNQSSALSTDPNYTSYAYDVMMNQALGKSDSRLLSHRGLRVNQNGTHLSPREENPDLRVDSSGNTLSAKEEDSNDDIFGNGTGMKGDVDGHTNVRNLCASMKYVNWSHFYTLTLNHKDHPGIKELFEWKNSEAWLKDHPDYPDLTDADKKEFIRGFDNAYIQMVTPKWIDITEVLIHKIKDTLTHIGAVSAVFGRHEYQDSAGNPSHIHMILAVEESSMQKETVIEYLNDLIAGQYMDIVRPEDIHDWLEEGFLVDGYDAHALQALAKTILSHTCNHRCQRRVDSKGDESDTKCRKLHSVKDSTDPTQDVFIEIEYEWNQSTRELLEKIGLYNAETDTWGNMWFTPHRHMTGCQSNATDNMSPVDRKLFAVLRAMQNLQWLLHTNGVCKYVVKYLVKIDEVNRVTMFVNSKTGAIEASKELLSNTKVSSSSINEKAWQEKQRHNKHPNGVEVAVTQMIHKILLRDEVITNLTFVDINTQPYEIRPQTQYELRKRKNGDIADRQDGLVPTERVREDLDEAYHITDGQKLTFGEKKTDKFDRVSEFGLREPRLLRVVNTPEAYFRFLQIDRKIQKDEISFCNDQLKDKWFDCLKRRTRIRKSALGELEAHIRSNIEEEYSDDPSAIRMNETILDIITLAMQDDSSLSPDELRRKRDICDTFIVDDKGALPPIPVVSQITPSNQQQFIIHILLTLGKYDTEKDVLLKPTMRECFREARLIGPNDDEESLRQDVGKILYRYITEQLIFSPYPLSKAEYYIMIGNQVFLDAIIGNGISMTEMPPVTLVGILENHDDDILQLWKQIKENQLDCILHQVNIDGAPNKEALMNCNRYDPIQWSPLDVFQRSPQQSEASFDEQKVAIDVAMQQICVYLDQDTNLQSRNVIIHGAPGAGKSFISFVISLFGISQGLNIQPTALAGVRAAAIGGTHWHNLFCVDPSKSTAPISRQVDTALSRINRNSLLVHRLKTIDILLFDEFYQFSSEQLAVTEMILRKLRKSNLPFGGVHILSNMDHAQSGPADATPILLSSFMTTCFILVGLEHSVRAHGDEDFQKLQKIARMSPLTLQKRPDLVSEFRRLASNNLTFVDDWNDPRITPGMLRVFPKRMSTSNAIAEATEQQIRHFEESGSSEFTVAHAIDQQRYSNSHEWTNATEQTIKSLNQSRKEPKKLCFFKGGSFEVTMNDTTNRGEQRYFQSQVAVVYEVPSQEMIEQRRAIPVLIPPPSADLEIDFDDEESCPSEEELIQQGWKRITIPINNQRRNVLFVRGGYEAMRQQYALRPLGASTIAKCQGQTCARGIATEISRTNAPWEGAQIVVVTSRSKTAEKTIIVGDKRFALDLMCELIQKPNQYSQLIEDMIDMLSVNSSRSVDRPVYGIDLRHSFPFQARSYKIPNDSCGYAYILYSLMDRRETYTGETENLCNRLRQHNSGFGSTLTAPIELRPWALGAFIVGKRLRDRSIRKAVEDKWRQAIERDGLSNTTALQRILLVKDIVRELNQYNEDDEYRYVVTVSSSGENDEDENDSDNDSDITPYDSSGDD